MVVLVTELEVAHNDGDFSAGDDEDQEDDEEETKDIVELVEPDGGHDEEDFNENSTEGKYTTNQDGEMGLGVPGAIGKEHTGDDVNLDRGFNGILLEPDVTSQVHKWNGDTEPKY